MKLSEIAFFSEDVASMTAFYRSLLGIEPAYNSSDLAIFDHGSIHILIHQAYVPGPADLPPDSHVAFAVADVDGACLALKEPAWNSLSRPGTTIEGARPISAIRMGT